jgi:hypothetical protein
MGDGPGSLPLYGLPPKLACLLPKLFPKEVAVTSDLRFSEVFTQAAAPIWLPVVDSFRTLAACPTPSVRAVFQSLTLGMVPWV